MTNPETTPPDAGDLPEPTWTEGVCGDGVAILRDGVMAPIEEVVRVLNRGEVGWQPIETAPKDGTVILATGGITWLVSWRQYPAGSYCDGAWQAVAPPGPSRDPAWSFQPTHWMPLPPPPATPDRQGDRGATRSGTRRAEAAMMILKYRSDDDG